jgi:hypothetical protein
MRAWPAAQTLADQPRSTARAAKREAERKAAKEGTAPVEDLRAIEEVRAWGVASEEQRAGDGGGGLDG